MPTKIEMPVQPSGTTCGPTSLYALYRYYGLDVTLDAVVDSVTTLPTGGTVDACLGADAIRRGFDARIVTTNLMMFDPTWAGLDMDSLLGKLSEMRTVYQRDNHKLSVITEYINFLRLGGTIEIVGDMPSKHIDMLPCICGLSYTALTNSVRYDNSTDVSTEFGELLGHFVLVSQYDSLHREYTVADPWPGESGQHYNITEDELNRAMLFGTATNDGGLLFIAPKQ